MKKNKILNNKEWDIDKIIFFLRKNGSEKNKLGMARFGINVEKAFGVNMPILRKLGKEIGKNRILAKKLWDTKIHEARILACLIEDPLLISSRQMDDWAKEFNSWDLCDQCCMNLFDKNPLAWEKAIFWTEKKEEFYKRAGFALMAALAFHDKKANNKDFFKFFSAIEKHSFDERNFVKKAINWALRQIGKRNAFLNKKAIASAERILKSGNSAGRWIASGALRELKGKNFL